MYPDAIEQAHTDVAILDRPPDRIAAGHHVRPIFRQMLSATPIRLDLDPGQSAILETMTDELSSWTRAEPITSPFAHPRGLRGRLAARIMAATSGRDVSEIAALLPLRRGQRVLEVGFGPGMLLAALHDRPEHPA